MTGPLGISGKRQKTLPSRLARISREISEAIKETESIKELAVQEEVVSQLDKVDGALEAAKREIARIMNPR